MKDKILKREVLNVGFFDAHSEPENGFLDRKIRLRARRLRRDVAEFAGRLWLSFDIAQIISNTSNHEQIILCFL